MKKRLLAITADCVVTPEAFDHGAGSTYKAFLMSDGLWVPLCLAAVLTQ